MERKRRNISHLFRGRRHDGDDAVSQSVPLRLFVPEPSPPGAGETVELRTPAVLALSPFETDQGLTLQPVERGIEGALRYLESLTGKLLNPEKNPVSVKRAKRWP